MAAKSHGSRKSSGGGIRSRHHLYLLVYLVMTALCAMDIPASGARPSIVESSPQPLHVHDRFGIEKAMQRGDSSALLAISKHHSDALTKSYALASYYRTRFNLELSSRYARECYDAGASVDLHNVVLIVLCGTLIAGNYSTAGHYSEWARTMQSMRDRTYPFFTKLFRAKRILYPFWGSAKHTMQMDSFFNVPSTRISISQRQPFIINRTFPTHNTVYSRSALLLGKGTSKVMPIGAPFLIKVTVNGHDATAMIDTGNPMTVMSQTLAQHLGIKVNNGNYYSLGGARKGSHVFSTHLGIARFVTMTDSHGSTIRWHNLGVVVGGPGFNKDSFGKNAFILGMNAISRLGSILLTTNQLIINPQNNISCNLPLTIASTMNGSYTLLLSHRIDGKLQKATLDTGSNKFITGTAVIANTQEPHTDNRKIAYTKSRLETGVRVVPYYMTRLSFGYGSATRSVETGVYPREQLVTAYAIGSQSLYYFKIFVNFNKRMACLIPNT